MEVETAPVVDGAAVATERPRRGGRPVVIRRRPATLAGQPPATDAGALDWPLERWTGPVYALGRGRLVGRRGCGWEGWLMVGGVSCAGLGLLRDMADWSVVAAIAAGVTLTGLAAGRRWWQDWLAAAFTPATARRQPPAARPATSRPTEPERVA